MQALYSHTGQPSLDPVVFFKLVLVDRLENLVSDRRLVVGCALRLDILWFLGYWLDEQLPWHSAVSHTRPLFPAAVFERLFDHVVAQCVARGLVAGDTPAVDSAPVKANASLDSLAEKQAQQPQAPYRAGAGPPRRAPSAPPLITAPAHHLRREAAWQAKRRAEPGPWARSTKKRVCSATRRSIAPPIPTRAFPSSPARTGTSTTSAAWLWTRPAASSATCRQILPTAAIACICPACSSGCRGAWALTSCAYATCWLMRATPTVRTMLCSKSTR
ncbi:transposase [Hymenobacter perfusus]|uniref:Transposase n=1 Tax=Hymenobacter perfusus TaxID=1236770 RepID=A0A3R9NVD3_9BACT|nr:transposase [Hymenobacter perfusus]